MAGRMPDFVENSIPEVSAMKDVLFESHLESLPLLHRGKVRDIYAVAALAGKLHPVTRINS